jgi:predicted outer membrane repeat protein
VLSGNWVIFYGGGVYNIDGNGIVALANCTLSGNSADNGGGIYSQNSDLLLTDSIIWGNNDNGGVDESAQIDVNDSVALVNYCCVQGWTGALNGIGNFDADPCFAGPGYWSDNSTPAHASDDFWADGDYHLKSKAGRWDPNENDWVYDDTTSPCIDSGDPNSDWTAELWPNGKRVNMGAYGGTNQASMNGNPCDFNVDGIVDFADFCDMADYWQAEGSLIEDLDYDNFINFADLHLFSDNWLWKKAPY